MRATYKDLERDMYSTMHEQTVTLQRKKVQLREAMMQVRAEREDDERARQEQAARAERRQKIERLQHAIADCRALLAAEQPLTNGEFDASATHNGSSSSSDNNDNNKTLQDRHANPIDLANSTLPMQDRLKVLLKHNGRLQERVNDLHDRSYEPVYARIVGLAIGRGDVQQADQDLDILTTAVQSEGAADVEITRVRGFLRKIRDLEDPDD